MFGSKKRDTGETEGGGVETPPQPVEEKAPDAAPAGPRERGPAAPRARAPAPRPEAVRRSPGIHPATRRGTLGADLLGDGNRLVVGREIVLSGRINACDLLIVEGRIEADTQDCRQLELTETGTFKGEAEFETADISGTFEGLLTTRGLLIVRASARISGKVRYGQLEVERGGWISGEVEAYAPDEAREPTPIHAAQASAE